MVWGSWSEARSHPVGLLLSWWKFDLSLTYVRQRPLGQVNCESVISDYTSACTIDTFFLQSVTSVMGSLGKSSQNVGVQSCYFNVISATNNTTLSPATVALHRHSQLIRWGKLPVKLMAQNMSYYAHRVNSFKLLAHVNCLMGVVHTTCRTTTLIAMYFGEYPIYLSILKIYLS